MVGGSICRRWHTRERSGGDGHPEPETCPPQLPSVFATGIAMGLVGSLIDNVLEEAGDAMTFTSKGAPNIPAAMITSTSTISNIDEKVNAAMFIGNVMQ